MAERLPIPLPPLLSLENPEKHLEKIVQYYVSKLQGLSTTDQVRSHMLADDLLCECLWELGYRDVVDAYRSARRAVGFSY